MKKLNIFCDIHCYNSERWIFIEPLERMGHNVYHFDWGSFGYSEYASDWEFEGKTIVNALMLDKLSKLHKEVGIDLFIGYLSDRTTFPTVIDIVTNVLKIPSINFSWDDHNKFELHTQIAPYFTLNWTTWKEAVEWYKDIGANALYLAGGSNPRMFKKLENIKKIYPVSFVGQNYGNRTLILKTLLREGLDLYVFGKGYKEVSIEKMVEIFNSSIVNLGFAGGWGGINEILKVVKGRDFEIPMSGGFYLTEYHEELEDYYEVGKEIETYRHIGELIDKARYYTNHPEEAEKIAERGHKRALQDHTMEKRFEVLFKHLGIGG